MKRATKILLADDDEGIVDATTMLLEMMGYEVESTLDGSTVPAAASSKPDLIIMDIWMGGVDGRDICRIIKGDPNTADIPVLLISAAQNIEVSAIESGADTFLEKPFELQDLIQTIERLVG